MNEFDKRQSIEEVTAILEETEALLNQDSDQAVDTQQALKAKISLLKDKLAATDAVLREKTRVAMQETDVYAHEHPWKVAAVSAGVAFVVGLLSSRRR